MKLETLKDIEKKALDIYQEHINIKTIIPEIFINQRQLAIKWIKTLRKKIDKDNQTDNTKKIIRGQIEILNIFFNITEDDLK